MMPQKQAPQEARSAVPAAAVMILLPGNTSYAVKETLRSFGGEVKQHKFHQLRFDELEYMNRRKAHVRIYQCFDVE